MALQEQILVDVAVKICVAACSDTDHARCQNIEMWGPPLPSSRKFGGAIGLRAVEVPGPEDRRDLVEGVKNSPEQDQLRRGAYPQRCCKQCQGSSNVGRLCPIEDQAICLLPNGRGAPGCGAIASTLELRLPLASTVVAAPMTLRPFTSAPARAPDRPQWLRLV